MYVHMCGDTWLCVAQTRRSLRFGIWNLPWLLSTLFTYMGSTGPRLISTATLASQPGTAVVFELRNYKGATSLTWVLEI